jgi:pimeloyl-ACP methyl ester carboxylesterase
MADWLLAALDAAGIAQAALVGHSMGSLIALEAAARAPQRVTHLALLGTAYPMKVADALLDGAQRRNEGHRHGHQMVAQSRLRQHRTAAPADAVSPASSCCTDLAACNSYDGGGRRRQQLPCPVHLRRADVMTPPKSAAALTAAIPHAHTITLEAATR